MVVVPIVVAQGTVYVGIGAGELVAVGLSDGAIHWRRLNAGSPIAASQAHLLTLGENGYELRSTESGDLVASLDKAGLPSADDLIEISVDESVDGPMIAWSSLPRYSGGAVPSPTRSIPTPTAYAVVVDLAKGTTKQASASVSEVGQSETPVELSVSGSTLILEAQSSAGGTRWSIPLGPAPQTRRPSPLPQ